MSVTTMTKDDEKTSTKKLLPPSRTAASSSAAAAAASVVETSETKTEVAHWLNQRNENTFKIKQALTFLHFLSLLITAIVYMAHAERYQARAVILTFGTFVLAFCIPPIGMIQPEDAPDATRRALGWMPERGDWKELKKEISMVEKETEKEKQSTAGKKKKGNGKKNGGKKND